MGFYEPAVGVEPTAYRLRSDCSASELRWHVDLPYEDSLPILLNYYKTRNKVDKVSITDYANSMFRRQGTLRVEDDQSTDGGGKTIVWIVSILLILLVLAGAGIYAYLATDFFNSNDENTEDTAASNQSNSPQTNSIVLDDSKPKEEDENDEQPPAGDGPMIEDESSDETPTPAPLIDKSIYSVQVLNGNGVAGSAGEVETVLTDAGFVVEATGNADTWDYQSTTYRVKSSLDTQVVEDLVEALEQQYTVVEGEAIAEGEAYDIIVIVGAN